MAVTLTTTAYSATPRALEKGVYSVSFDYTTPAASLSASTGAVTILGPQIQTGTTILAVIGHHSSGAATWALDIGLDSSLSILASQQAQGTNRVTSTTILPYKVSLSDDAASLFSTVKLTGAPSSDTAAARVAYTFLLQRDQPK